MNVHPPCLSQLQPLLLEVDRFRVGLAWVGQVVMRGLASLPGEVMPGTSSQPRSEPGIGWERRLHGLPISEHVWCPQWQQQNQTLLPEGIMWVSMLMGSRRPRQGRCLALGHRAREPGTVPASLTPICLSHFCTCCSVAFFRDKRLHRTGRERMYGIPWQETKITFKTPQSLHTQAHTVLTKHHPQFEASFTSPAGG